MDSSSKSLLTACWFFLPFLFVVLLLYVAQSVVLLAIGMAICSTFAFYTSVYVKPLQGVGSLLCSLVVSGYLLHKQYPCAQGASSDGGCLDRVIFFLLLFAFVLQMFGYGIAGKVEGTTYNYRQGFLQLNVAFAVLLILGMMEGEMFGVVVLLCTAFLYVLTLFLLFLFTFRYTTNYLYKKRQQLSFIPFAYFGYTIALMLLTYSQNIDFKNIPKELFLFTVFYLGSLLVTVVGVVYINYVRLVLIRESTGKGS